MNQKKYAVKGTPILPAICGLGMAVLWYMFFYFSNGKWEFSMELSFEGLQPVQIYFMILTLLIPLSYFVCTVFLVELDLRWMLIALLIPIVSQVSTFVYYLIEKVPDYIFMNPISFVMPFLALILFVLTVEKILPTKWVFVGFCGVAVLLPLILTLFAKGEFVGTLQTYDETYQIVTVPVYLWSNYLSYALYYVGLGALAVEMRVPGEDPDESAEASEEAEALADDGAEDDQDFDEDSPEASVAPAEKDFFHGGDGAEEPWDEEPSQESAE